MSGPAGKRELSGLARSIDELFTRAAEAATETIVDDLPPGPSVDGVAPALEPSTEDVAPEPSAEDVAAEPVSERAEREPSIAEAYAGAASASSLVAAAVEPVAAVSDEAPASVGADGADDEPTELDHAVDAYLAGDAGKAAEIQSIADEMLERKAVGPVARSVGRLVLAAGDPPDATTYGVAESLMSPVVLGRLARQMGAELDEEKRRGFYTVCRVVGEPMAHAVRADLAETTDRHARRVHCEALVEMGDVGRRIIEEMVDDENRFLVRNAVSILGDVGGGRAVELVTTALANPDARVRREALRSLAKLGDPQSGELVVGLLDDTDREVQIAAAVAAGELGVERGLRPIIALLDASKDPDETIPLVRALGQLGDPSAVAAIEKHAKRGLFSAPRSDVRIAAYRALSEMGTPQARRLLNDALSDKDEEVREAVMDMLDMR